MIFIYLVMVDVGDFERRKEIDKDVSSYISGLRRKEKGSFKDILKKFKRKKKQAVELHPEVSMYGPEGKVEEKKSKEEIEKEEEELEQEFEEEANKKTIIEWIKGLFASPRGSSEDEDEFEKVEEPVEEKVEEEPQNELEEEYREEVIKESWLTKLIAKLFVKSREEDELEDVQDEIAEDVQDMKKIAEIATKVMKKLPPEEMKVLKESPDFETFKEILKKRDLIK